eukprot:3934068-Rhodomonas_salina.2
MDQVQESELQEGHMKVSARTSGCSQTERGFTVPDSDRGLTVPDLHTAPGRCVMIVLAQPESGVNRTFDGLFPGVMAKPTNFKRPFSPVDFSVLTTSKQGRPMGAWPSIAMLRLLALRNQTRAAATPRLRGCFYLISP